MEAWQMAAKLSDGAILAILGAHPGLRERFASIAIALADQEGNLKEADAIGERLVEEMRLLGRAAIQGWAENQVEATEKEIRQHPRMHRQGKKNSAAAAKAIAQDAAAQDAWMDAQKEALKTGRLDKALQALAGHIEASEADDDQAPVRRCHRY